MPPTEINVSEAHFVDEGNNLKVLCAMAVGIIDDDGKDIGDFERDVFPKTDFKKWKPNKAELAKEVSRRKKILQIPTAPNQQKPKADQLAWLIQHALFDENDTTFIKQRLQQFLDTYHKAKDAKNTPVEREQWSGMIPYLRLIHCITDFDEIKEAFHESFTVLSREELDGRNNPDTMRADCWALAAEKWNNYDYNVLSTPYTDLHDDFVAPIDLSFSNVANMGTLTADKAKSKFYKIKNDLILVKCNWEMSGNGDGTMVRNVDKNDLDAEEIEIFNANDKRNFLHGRSPAVLYLWEKAKEHSLLHSVCQQLDPAIGFDSCDRSSEDTRQSKKRKAKNVNDGEDNDDNVDPLMGLMASIEESNEIARASIEAEGAKMRADKTNFLLSHINDLETKRDVIEDKLDELDRNDRGCANKVGRLDTRLLSLTNRIVFHQSELAALSGI